MIAPSSHHLWYGQSKAVGGSAFNSSGGVKSTTPLIGAVRFNQGILAWETWQGDPRSANTTDALKRASFVDLIEEKCGSSGESGCYGFAQGLRHFMALRGISSGGDYKVIMSSAGQGDRTIAQLSKGGGIYPRIEADITYGYLRSRQGAYADGQPRRYALESFTLDQGESDSDGEAWKAAVLQLKDDVEADAATITGKTRAIPFFVPQLAANPVIAKAQLELGLTPANGIYCPTPLYPFVYVSPPNNVHLSDVGSYERGLYCGVVAGRVLIDGEDWKPIHPVEHETDDVFLRVRFAGGNLAKGGRLLFSNPSYCPQASGNGFVLRHPNGNVNAYRSSVCLGDWVEFRFDSGVQPGSKLTTMEGSGVGPSGPRVNLRDNQGDSLSIGGRPMHNWCVHFERTIN